ncbi:hypothetical protein [Campylobacter fetus]|uniref:hypothetical protein n=1 Tax=Campylobacter fetus TaxID=196 RepID=UPI000CFC0B2D|nr:hypothetical protein [Campylobacter fetus]AVK80652.1 hypothetical protein C6B32_01975 [Campylobacter fetus subsp. testudinum]
MTHRVFIFIAIVFSAYVCYVYFLVENLKNDLNTLQKQLTIKTYENSICSANLDKQNKAIESLRVEVKPSEVVKERIKSIKSIDIGAPHNSGALEERGETSFISEPKSIKIKAKHETCEAKLFAYERLFDSSF